MPETNNQGTLVRVRSFGFNKVETKIVSNVTDPWDSLYTSNDQVLRPVWDPLSLEKMVEVSDILLQCITAMYVNIDGFGYELVRTDNPSASEITEVPPEAKAERKILEQFLTYTNDREDITQLRKTMRHDLEITGTAYWEIVRNRLGEIVEIHNLPSHTARLVLPDAEFTQYEQYIPTPDGKGWISVTRWRRFGRIVQMLPKGGNQYVYFKEFGDPRNISKETGKIASGNEELATEVMVFRLPCSYSPYGLPRWLGQLMAILGSRKAEEVNYLFFDNKTIPPLIIMVSGGSLTQDSLTKLEDLFNKELKGVENFHKSLLLEATPHSSSDIPGEKVSPVRIEVKPLTEFIQKDATFSEYRASNRSNIRSAFRLPPLYTGDTVDYTRATAYESARVAEEQVFEPERKSFDYTFNRMILSDLRISYWKLKSIGAKTSDDAQIVTAMGNVKDAIPVGYLVEAVQEMRNVPKGDIPAEWYTKPLGQFLAEFAAKQREQDLSPRTGGAASNSATPPKGPSKVVKSDEEIAQIEAYLNDKIAELHLETR